MKRVKNEEIVYSSNRENSEISVYQYGKHVCPPSHFYGPSTREYYLVHFVIKGKGTYRVGDKVWNIEKNQGFLIRPGEETFYQADQVEPWEYYFVGFHGTGAKKLVDSINWVDGYIIKPNNFSAITRCLKDMYSIKKLEAWSECRIIGDIYILISALIKEGMIATQKDQAREKISVLNDAIDYIRNNYEKDISVEDIAKKANVHRTNLYRLFKEKLDISVIKYLKNYRLDMAASLLLTTELTAYEIAEKVGMEDYPHFSKQFKASYRYTPSVYRKKFKKKTQK